MSRSSQDSSKRNGQSSEEILGVEIHADDLEPLRAFFSVFCSKWSVFVVAALAPSEMTCATDKSPAPSETLRRNQLAKRIPGVSEKVLTTTLRHMEEAGLVHKEIFAEVPSHVEYSLTKAGCCFLEPLRGLKGWCEAHDHDLDAAYRLLGDKKC